MTAEELLQQINLIRLNDNLSWIEQNNAIMELIKKRDRIVEEKNNAFYNMLFASRKDSDVNTFSIN